MQDRKKTDYPGVFFRLRRRVGGPGEERIFYVLWKDSDGKLHEEKVGRQYRDDMTPAKAARIRAEYIEGKRTTRKERKEEAKEEAWTFDRLWEAYKQSKTFYRGLARDENRYKKWLHPYFGNKRPEDVAPLDLDRLRVLMTKQGKKSQTVRLAFALLKRLSIFGKKKQLTAPITFMIEMPKQSEIKNESLTAEQLQSLIEALNEEDNHAVADIMRFVLVTGLRRGEIFRLQWNDVDFEHSTIFLRNPKGGRDEWIPMNDAAKGILERQPRHSTFCFPGRDGDQRTDINHMARRVCAAAGLPEDFRPLHGLRHVFASNLAASGAVTLQELSRLLTHKDLSLIQRYAHLQPDSLKRASQVAADIFAQPGGKAIRLRRQI